MPEFLSIDYKNHKVLMNCAMMNESETIPLKFVLKDSQGLEATYDINLIVIVLNSTKQEVNKVEFNETEKVNSTFFKT